MVFKVSSKSLVTLQCLIVYFYVMIYSNMANFFNRALYNFHCV